MRVVTTNEGGIVRVDVEGDIDAHTARDLEATLTEALAVSGAKVVVGLSGVGYVASAGLRVFLRARAEATKNGGVLALFDLTEFVQKVFVMAGFDKVLTLTKAHEDAVKAVSTPPSA